MQINIKPLEWRDPCDETNGCWVGVGPIHYHKYPDSQGYWISNEDGRFHAGVDDGRRGEAQDLGSFDELYVAKAAAQADYEARVLSALSPPAQEPVAWRVRVKSDDPEEWSLLPAGGGADYSDRAGYEFQPLYTSPAQGQREGTFQERVQPWMMACFGPEISADKLERCDRFIEEALELVQAGDYPKERALALVDYVYGRDQGDIKQEVGGVMITLAAHCLAHGVDMHEAGETELARVWTKVDQIRAKQAAKPTGSALPVSSHKEGDNG